MLSTATVAPRSRAIPESSSMSERVSMGLVGVSIQSNFVSGRSASSTEAGSVVSTKAKSRPLDLWRTLSKRRYEPP